MEVVKMAFVSECGCKDCKKMHLDVEKLKERHKEAGRLAKVPKPPKGPGLLKS